MFESYSCMTILIKIEVWKVVSLLELHGKIYLTDFKKFIYKYMYIYLN